MRTWSNILSIVFMEVHHATFELLVISSGKSNVLYQCTKPRLDGMSCKYWWSPWLINKLFHNTEMSRDVLSCLRSVPSDSMSWQKKFSDVRKKDLQTSWLLSVIVTVTLMESILHLGRVPLFRISTRLRHLPVNPRIFLQSTTNSNCCNTYWQHDRAT